MASNAEAGELSQHDLIRLAAERDLEVFIRLVSPKQVLGAVHLELIRWLTRSDRKAHQLTLLPRDHQKSRIIAYKVAWYITNHPDARILYISATANLAEKQLKFIKDIITSPIYRKYWPEMVNLQEGQREKWTNTEVSVDHPKRKEEGVRDPTIFTGGLTTGLTGLHCDVAVLDDVVVPENAYTEIGREAVRTQYSLLSSIEGADSEEWVVGTRYHPKDLYGELLTMEEDIFDDEGNIIDGEAIYEVFQREVEDRGDGTGNFLWPKQMRPDGKWFGFDRKVLSKKRAKYIDKSQFRAQYYNDPNDTENAPIPRDLFQYYEKKWLNRQNGKWFFKGKKLNVFAAIDFAFSRANKADYTALVVIGVDANSEVYVLDIERIKTDRISDYYDLIIRKHVQWDFRKLRVEINQAQKSVVQELKYSYLMPNGIALSLDEVNRNSREGSKEERISVVLEHRYHDRTVWHYQGGECQNLEEELILQRPPHDDIKDALANAIEIAVPPLSSGQTVQTNNVVYHPRFGGVSI